MTKANFPIQSGSTAGEYELLFGNRVCVYFCALFPLFTLDDMV